MGVLRFFIDISLIFFMLVFSYAFGRRSESDNKLVIPPQVTWFTLFILVGILLLMNLTSLADLMSDYDGGE